MLAWELRNEQFFEWDLPPFSLTSGRATTANGMTYDLAEPAAKERTAVDGVRTYISRVAAAVRRADPGVLVTMGFFDPQPPDDPRFVRTAPLLAEAALDFFDFHYYPGGRASLAQAVAGFGMEGYASKPILLGEYGALKFAYPTPADGASALVDLQVGSCPHGFDGWLYWLWDVSNDELWTGPEDGGAINAAMSPKGRPDPCAYDAGTIRDLARGKPVAASRSQPTNPPELAVDGTAETGWISGADAPSGSRSISAPPRRSAGSGSGRASTRPREQRSTASGPRAPQATPDSCAS